MKQHRNNSRRKLVPNRLQLHKLLLSRSKFWNWIQYAIHTWVLNKVKKINYKETWMPQSFLLPVVTNSWNILLCTVLYTYLWQLIFSRIYYENPKYYEVLQVFSNTNLYIYLPCFQLAFVSFKVEPNLFLSDMILWADRILCICINHSFYPSIWCLHLP